MQGPSAAPDAGGALASYRGGVVTREDVARELARLPGPLRDNFSSRNGQREFARSLVDKRLLVQEARRRGLDAEPDTHRQVLELEERLIVQALLAAEERAAGAPGEAELRAFFDAHKQDFEQPERVRVVRVLAQAEGAGLKAARARALGWRARLERGEPLEKVAAEGDGPERSKGGDLGFLAVGDADPALVSASLAMKALGKPSEPVVCREGIAVLVVQERKDRRFPSFEEVRAEVEGRVAPQRKRKVFDDVLVRLRAKADVKVDVGP